MRVSHSAINEYNECSMKYKINRIDKIRPHYKSSAFIFGSAIDDASEAILFKKRNYKQVFKDAMAYTNVDWQNDSILVPTSEYIKYFASDLQPELIKDWQHKLIVEFVDRLFGQVEPVDFDFSKFVDYCKDCRKRKKHLSTNEQRLYNYINWCSLYQKGLMLLEKFKEFVEENIEEVHEVQKFVQTTNGNKDQLVGYIDFIVTFKDGVKRIIDLKTASDPNKQYPDNCIDDSQQLTIYSEIQGISEVGYLVLDKKIRKRDPRVRLKFITGKISEENADKVFDNIEETMLNIKEGIFEYNWDACNNYGGCPYYSYCRSGGEDVRNLIKKKG
jgi:hypothetical protein